MTTPEQPQRPPLVGDELIAMHIQRAENDTDLCDRIRQEYEDLITSGHLRVMKEAEGNPEQPKRDECTAIAELVAYDVPSIEACRIVRMGLLCGRLDEAVEEELRKRAALIKRP